MPPLQRAWRQRPYRSVVPSAPSLPILWIRTSRIVCATHKSTHKCIVDVAGQAWTPLHTREKKLQQLSGLFDANGNRWTDVDTHLVGLSLRPSSPLNGCCGEPTRSSGG